MDKAVIFDMDGVIADTNPYHSIAFREFFGKRNLQPTDQEFAQHMFGKSNRYILEYFLRRKITDLELKQMEAEKEGLFREIYKSQVKPLKGFLLFLRDLKEAGFKTGVATSAPRANLNLIMGVLGFEKHMESILASENVSHHKPNPEVYLKSAENLGVEPSDCLVFEDSFSGISAGLNAGMKTVGVLTSHTEEELPRCSKFINDFTEISVQDILEILKK